MWEALAITEAAAIAAYNFVGRGNENEADQAAVNAMRQSLANAPIDGTIVIGEGERDNAPMLYIGEKVGMGGYKMDIALDPLEGTSLCAHAGPNSMSVIAMTESGGLLNAPDVYMEKIAIGLPYEKQIIDLDLPVKENISNLAKAKNCDITDLSIVILDRPRHVKLIEEVRRTGAKIQLIKDGDIAAVIATAMPEAGVDMYIGVGGAPEGVLAAAALATTGGQMCCKLLFSDKTQEERAISMGITDLNRKYYIPDLARGKDIVFAATGVTSGSMLEGVKKLDASTIRTSSVCMSSYGKLIRYVKTEHKTQ